MYKLSNVSKLKHLLLLLVLFISSFNYILINDLIHTNQEKTDTKPTLKTGVISNTKDNSVIEKNSVKNSQTSKKVVLSTASLDSIQSISAYPTKSPFTITNNNQFLSNGFTGSGTQADPYILEHWNFYYNTMSTTAISVSNTDVYFEIYQNTFSTNVRSSSFSPFISLSNVSHVTVQNNTFTYGYTSIKITGTHSNLVTVKDNLFQIIGEGVAVTATSEPVLIKNNTFNDITKNAITLTSIQNVTIDNNIIMNDAVGLSITGTNSTGISITNNTLTNGQTGIGAFSTQGGLSIINNTITTQTSSGITISSTKNNNRIENNTLINTTDIGISITSSVTGSTYGTDVKFNNLTNGYIFVETSSLTANYTQGQFVQNFVNNRPVDFFQYTNNPQFSSNPAEIIVLYSTNVTIKDLPAISGPFIVSSSTNVYISNMTVNNSHYNALDLYKNKNVTVINNKFLNLWANGIKTNAYTTATAFQMNVQNNLISSSGNCPQLYCDGLTLSKIASNSTIYNNTIENFQYGIHLYYSDNQTILKNTVTNSSKYGIFVDYSNNVNMTDNSIQSIDYNAMGFIGVTSIKDVKDNRFYNSSVDLANFIGFSFTNNTYENKQIFIFVNLQNQVLSPNATIPSVIGQIYFQNAQFVDLKDLTILYDVRATTSVNVTVNNITIRDHGLQFFDCHNGTFTNNRITSGYADGLHIQSDANFFDNMVVRNNTIIGKEIIGTMGVYLSGINNFIIEDNSIKHFPYGVFLNGDANGIVRNNIMKATDNPSYIIGAGISVSYAVSENNIFSSNTISYYYEGIFINYNVVNRNIFFNNSISHGYYGINYSQSSNSSVDSNYFSNNIVGAYLNKANFNTLTNNIFDNNTNYNLYLTQATFNTFNGNVFANSTYHDVDLTTSSINNTFDSNNFINNSRYVIFDSTSGNNTVKNNIFVHTLYEALQIASANNLITNNDFIGNNWTNTNFPPGKQIQVLNANNIVLGNYYSDHSNLDFNWDDVADSPYTNFGSSLIDPSPKVRPIFLPDAIAPKLFILPGNNTVYNSSGFILSYNISERSVNQIYINGMPNGTILASGTNMSYLGDGTYNITIRSIDLAGNVATIQIMVIIDTVPPQITFINPNNITYITPNVNVSYTIVDKSTYTLIIYINGVQNNTVANNSIWTFKQGLNNITFYAVDEVGNVAINSIYFTVDSLPPVLTVYNPTNTTYYVSPVLFNYSISDVSSYSVTIYINNNPNASAINPESKVDFTNGYYNITFLIIDSFNHNTTYSFFFTVDLLPVVNIYTLSNASYNTNNLMINFTYEGAVNVNFTIDGIANSTTLLNGSVITFADGYHNITIYGFDSIGRNSSKTYIFLIDSIAPVITIISPISKTYSTGQVIINYQITENNSYTMKIIIDGNDNTTSIINGSSMDFSDGPHNLTIYVVDEAGNMAVTTVNFSVSTSTSSGTTPTTTPPISTTPTTTLNPGSNTISQSSQISTSSPQASPISFFAMMIALLIVSTLRVLYLRKKVRRQ